MLGRSIESGTAEELGARCERVTIAVSSFNAWLFALEPRLKELALSVELSIGVNGAIAHLAHTRDPH